jgi:hypothetical protein
MNIALGALIITLLLLPALFFRIGMALLAIFSSGEPAEGPYRDASRAHLGKATGWYDEGGGV